VIATERNGFRARGGVWRPTHTPSTRIDLHENRIEKRQTVGDAPRYAVRSAACDCKDKPGR